MSNLKVVQEEQKKEQKQMFEYEQAGNTPFMLVKKLIDDDGDDKHEYFCVIGEHRVTRMYRSSEEAIKEVEVIDWSRIGAVVEATCKAYINEYIGQEDNK